MNWWNRTRKIQLSVLGGFLFVIGISIVVLRLVGPKIGNTFCTMADCIGNGIHIEFVDGNVPEKFSIEVDFPNGKRTLECNNSSDLHFTDRDTCKTNGAFFKQLDDLPPEELFITVLVVGTRISKTFHPEYRIRYPNGEDCPPLCYFATIEFDLSQ